MGRGFGITSRVGHDEVRELARHAEQLGYSSFWVNDVPNAEGLDSLAAAAGTTVRIGLGVGVIPLDQRSPAAIAERIRSHELPTDRLLLGVGGGATQGALARVRAGVDVLRGDVGSNVIVGALGPKMAALAGETADGALLNWLTPEHAVRAGRWVRTAAEEVGHPRPSVMAYVRCGLTPRAESWLQAELAHYVGVAPFEEHLARMGVGAADTCVLGPDRESLHAGIAAYEGVLDETIVRAIAPDDDADELAALLHACAPER
jgi:alkanesulfonate monooxygenase SsuD/methylene tetrahydromethanopterin reductase-like flavin-dependent oxidoreductase (luciferase family)